jgi:hypothetical protein
VTWKYIVVAQSAPDAAWKLWGCSGAQALRGPQFNCSQQKSYFFKENIFCIKTVCEYNCYKLIISIIAAKINVAINYNLTLMTPIAVTDRQNVSTQFALFLCSKQLY